MCIIAALASGIAAGHVEASAEKPWKNTAELSYVSTTGNSTSLTVAAKNLFSYAWNRMALELAAGALGSSSTALVTAEQYNASQKIIFNIAQKDYVYERFGWDRNRFAGIAHRYDISGGYGRTLMSGPRNTLIAELGAGYINEQRIASPRNAFASARAYAKYAHNLTDTAQASQDAEYLANLEDTQGYRINTESALLFTISSHMSLKVSYIWNRVNQPVPGFKKDDTTTSVALIVNY